MSTMQTCLLDQQGASYVIQKCWEGDRATDSMTVTTADGLGKTMSKDWKQQVLHSSQNGEGVKRRHLEFYVGRQATQPSLGARLPLRFTPSPRWHFCQSLAFSSKTL